MPEGSDATAGRGVLVSRETAQGFPAGLHEVPTKQGGPPGNQRDHRVPDGLPGPMAVRDLPLSRRDAIGSP